MRTWQGMAIVGLSFIAALGTPTGGRAQDDLLDVFGESGSGAAEVPVTATFKDVRIVNLQSNETPGSGVLHFGMAHRFGRLLDGPYTLWGLDQATMRISLQYGVTDRIALGLARNTLEKTYEANVKAKLIEQSNAKPLSITWYSVALANGSHWNEPGRDNLFSSRLSFVHQAVITRKVNRNLSLAVVPSLVHRNLVPDDGYPNDQWVISAGGRYKLTPGMSINGEYHYRLNPADFGGQNGLSIGVDIETGGHVFQLHLTNSLAMHERGFLTETAGRWSDGDIHFGFNFSRVFNVKN